jgi:hypothetical protein
MPRSTRPRDDDQAFAVLTHEHPGRLFKRGNTAVWSTSSFSSAPVFCEPLISPREATKMLHTHMASYFQDRYNAFLTGKSTYRCRNDVIHDITNRVGRGVRSVEYRKIATLLPSTA